MAHFDYKAARAQMLAQGIAFPGLDLSISNEVDEHSQHESSEIGSGSSSPPAIDILGRLTQVTLRESEAQNERSFEFGRSLEGDLIEIMKDYRCVWDVSCRAFKEHPKKQQAWKEIAVKLKQDENVLKRIWKNLRDNFSKCVKKRELLSRSGAGATELPLFKELQFLKDKVSNRVTHSNLSIPQPSLEKTGEIDFTDDTSSSTQCGNTCSTPEPMHSVAETPRMKRKRTLASRETQETCNDQPSTSSLDCAISQYLNKHNSQENNADNMFCQSLVPILSSLPAKKNRKAKIEIQNLLFDIEFSED